MLREDTRKELWRMMNIFVGSFINADFEVILIPQRNIYFNLNNVNTIEDLQVKFIHWITRDTTFKNYRSREKYNEYLKTNFSREELVLVYEKLGSARNENLCRKFIKNKFNLKILK
ncbi:hypothetical protein SAMN02745174_02427 [Cetobacterium ceti]|uniref:Uncharacterized protein n=1 Tax=Cetobacterium ceti TaxID=180163 RepID=A0A1T4QSD8_9FUSO|nr:hypothetical protein [Cetobacterium ceti]SKA06586.1 hypothetical protein SAMN02745174_02427 [Cetobacterium ceti]